MSTSPVKPVSAPLLSVVIPVYNAEPYLRQCLDSVLGSTMDNLEVLCIDDGSTDCSRQILEAYQAEDQRVRVFAQDHLYAGAARNKGIEEARGTFVHFLDADDYVDMEAYGQWCELAQAHKADYCECLYVNVEASTEKVLVFDEYLHETTSAQIYEPSIALSPKTLIYGRIAPWNKLFRRAFLIDEDIRFDVLICAEDRSFYYEALFKARRIVRTHSRWITHRLNIGTSLDGSSVRLEHFDVEFRSFERIWELASDLNEDARLMLLDSCINDSVVYFTKAIGTPYEDRCAEMLYSYWQDWLPLLGETVYETTWYNSFVGVMVRELPGPYRDNLLGLSMLHREETIHKNRVDKLARLAVKAMALASGPVRAVSNRLRKIPRRAERSSGAALDEGPDEVEP